MTKDEIGLLIGEEIYQSLKIMAENNGIGKTFTNYQSLITASTAIAAVNVTKMLAEKGIITVD